MSGRIAFPGLGMMRRLDLDTAAPMANTVVVYPPDYARNQAPVVRLPNGRFIDGDAATAGIQSAFDWLDRLNVVYGVVLLAAGLFDGITSNIVIPSKRTLRGSGEGVTIIRSGVKAWADTGLLRVIDVSEVTIADLTVDGAKATNTNGRSFGVDIRGGTKIRLFHVASINHPGQNAAGTNGGDGLYIRDGIARSEDIQALGCTFQDNVRQGASVIDVKDLSFFQCRFVGTTGTNPGAGIDLEPNTAGHDIENVRIIGCHFEDNNQHIVVQDSSVDRTWGVAINGCTFEPHRKTSAGAIFVTGGPVTITGNPRMRFNAWTMIELRAASNVVIGGNYIEGSDNTAERAAILLIDCTNCVLLPQRIHGCNQNGIHLNQLDPSAAIDMTDIAIIGQQITDCGRNAQGDAAIRIRSDNAGGQNVFRLTLIGNIINDTRGASAADWGIRTSECVAADWDTWTAYGNQIAGTVNDAGTEFTKHLLMTDTERPAAGVKGRSIFNDTDGNLNIDTGAAWILPDGTST